MVKARLSRQHGFTLLEIMVTILIIGIVTGMATAFLRFSPQQQLSRETEKLWQLFNLAHDESSIRGHVYGWKWSDGKYQFMKFNPAEKQWFPITESPLQPRVLDDDLDIQIDFSLDNKPKKPSDRSLNESSDIPQIMFFSNGESTPFHLIINQRNKPLAKEDLSWLDSEGIGRVFLNTPETRSHD